MFLDLARENDVGLHRNLRKTRRMKDSFVEAIIPGMLTEAMHKNVPASSGTTLYKVSILDTLSTPEDIVDTVSSCKKSLSSKVELDVMGLGSPVMACPS